MVYDVTPYHVTASGVIQVKNEKSTRDGPVAFLVEFCDGVKCGRQIWNCARDDVKHGHQGTLIDGMTTSEYGLTPSACFSYIYTCLFCVLKRETWWRTLGLSLIRV